jgi:transposase-like protein
MNEWFESMEVREWKVEGLKMKIRKKHRKTLYHHSHCNILSVMSHPGYPVAVKQRALELYLTTALTIKEIAQKVGVAYGTVTVWSSRHKWAAVREKYADELRKSFEMEQLDIAKQNRTKVIRRQLGTSENLDDTINAELDTLSENAMDKNGHRKTVGTGKIADLARAAKASADIAARAVGLDKYSTMADDQNKQQNQSPVLINIAPSGPANDEWGVEARKPKPIDASPMAEDTTNKPEDPF